MLEISAAIARRLIPILGFDPSKTAGIRSWLEVGSYQVGGTSIGECLKIEGVSLKEVTPFLLWDYERFCFSSLESLRSCRPSPLQPKAISWPLIKLYYSAFFAAHSLMRATGRGVVRLERQQAQRLSEIAAIFIDGLAVESGTYEFRIEQDNFRSINLFLRRLPEKGGAHEQFWRQFYIFLSNLCEQAAAEDEPGAAVLIGEVNDLQAVLAGNGLSNGTWLSAIRNKINYQHEYGVWYPYHPLGDAMFSMNGVGNKTSSSIRRDFNPSRNPLCAFSAACQIIAAINKDVADALARRPKASRFKQSWERLESVFQKQIYD